MLIVTHNSHIHNIFCFIKTKTLQPLTFYCNIHPHDKNTQQFYKGKHMKKLLLTLSLAGILNVDSYSMNMLENNTYQFSNSLSVLQEEFDPFKKLSTINEFIIKNAKISNNEMDIIKESIIMTPFDIISNFNLDFGNLLHSSIFLGHIELAKFLIENIDSFNQYQSPFIDLNVHKKIEKLYEESTENVINLYKQNPGFIFQPYCETTPNSPIKDALMNNRTEFLLNELQNPNFPKAFINFHDNALGMNSIHIAAIQGNIKLFETLVKAGGNPNIKNFYGHTAYDYLKITSPSFKKVNFDIDENETDSIVVVQSLPFRKLQRDSLKIMIDNSPKKNTSFSQNTPYIKKSFAQSLADFCPEFDVALPINPCNNYSFSEFPLHQLATDSYGAQYEEMFSIVQENIGFVHSFDKWGRTPLHLAVINNNVELCTLLLALGANVAGFDVNYQDLYGRTPLHTAIMYHSTKEIMETIINFCPMINLVDSENRTLVHYSVIYEMDPKLLKETIIDFDPLLFKSIINDKDNNGMTAMDYELMKKNISSM